MANQYVNKVVYGTTTLIDITDSTVTPASLMRGVVAYGADGSRLVGTATGGGSVSQDSDGYIILPEQGGGSSVTVDALSVTANGTYTAPTGHAYSPVAVNVSGAGGDSGDRSDPIRFFDYDGRLVASYTSVPLALPDVPTHSKLTDGVWNYTLAQVAEQFDAVGKCDVGANYDTASGKTEIDVTLDSEHLKPYLCVAVNGTVTVDWGDGSSTDTITGTSWTVLVPTQHVYSQAGSYTISIDGAVGFYSNNTGYPAVLRGHGLTSGNRQYDREYCNCVTAIRVADGSRIGDRAFNYCYSLQSVSIHKGVTSIGKYAFQSCYSLQSATIPASVTSIGSNAFYNCNSLQSVTIPAGVTSIGASAFTDCHSMQSVTIPASVTSIGSYAFAYCHSLQSATIPASVTSISSYAFTSCFGMQSVTISAGVTSIGNYAFNACHSMQSVTIPASVTSIGGSAFAYCYGTYEYHLEATVPPTLASTNVFNSIVDGTTIYVPKGCLEAYQTATNWSTYASYMVEEEA